MATASTSKTLQGTTVERVHKIRDAIKDAAARGLVRELPAHLYPALVAAPAMTIIGRWVRSANRSTSPTGRSPPP